MAEVSSVAKCANPECKMKFRRLGEGKLYIRPLKHTNGANRANQKAAWLCDKCSADFDLRFDRRNEMFTVIRHKRVA